MSKPSNKTVLYVEDEEADVLFMQMAFKKAGLATALQTVNDGRAAIEYLSGDGAYTNRLRYPLPKLVLLDLNLPVVSGFEVLKWMRRHAGHKRTPVVIFSSSSREEDKQKAGELGADDYIEKPNSAQSLDILVQRLQARWLA